MFARYYNSATGKFLSPDWDAKSSDPVPYAKLDDPQSLNLYSYVYNNPLIRADKDGHCPEGCELAGDTMVGMGHPGAFRALGQMALSLAPGIGQILALGSALSDLRSGHPAAAAMSLATAIPFEGAIGKGAQLLSRADGVVAKEITLSRALHGEAAEHAADAIKNGKPDILTIDRPGAGANRQASIGQLDKVPGKHLDEFPPAMFKEGGSDASVRAINPRDNMSAGAYIGNATRGLPDGAKVRIKVGD